MSGDRGHFDPARYAERIAEESAQRDKIILSSLENMSRQILGLQEDVRRGNLNDLQAEKRFNELEMQVRETRESVNLHMVREAEAAARGGAAGAVESLTDAKIGPAITKAMNRASGKTSRATWIAIVMIVALWLTNFVEKAPAVFRAVGAFFTGVTELDK